jgi:hypothetical protein
LTRLQSSSRFTTDSATSSRESHSDESHAGVSQPAFVRLRPGDGKRSSHEAYLDKFGNHFERSELRVKPRNDRRSLTDAALLTGDFRN